MAPCRSRRRPLPGLLTLLIVLAPLALGACSATTPQFERSFGDAVRIAHASQVLAPAAAANRDPVAGLDGRAARHALEAYQKSFAAPAPQGNSFTIGVGSGK